MRYSLSRTEHDWRQDLANPLVCHRNAMAGEQANFIFWPETLAVVSFIYAWLVKGPLFSKDQ